VIIQETDRWYLGFFWKNNTAYIRIRVCLNEKQDIHPDKRQEHMEKDRELIRKILSGDIKAFKILFDEYKNSVFHVCCRFTGNKRDAEDLCQDVFIKIYQTLHTFRQESKLSTWIYRITVNHCLNHIRGKRKQKIFSAPENIIHKMPGKSSSKSSGNQPDRLMEQKEMNRIISSAIDSLSERQKTVLILQKYEGLSCQEIATMMNCSLASVNSMLQRAKKNLIKKLKPYLDDL
jgi:RNA polymerase sigma-70 factor (ECF subfamily)